MKNEQSVISTTCFPVGKTSSKGKDKLKDKKSKDKRTKDKGGESEDTVEKKIVDAKDKKNAKKGKVSG